MIKYLSKDYCYLSGMKKSLLYLFFIFQVSHLLSQTTWSDHAAQVFYDKCAQCHNPNGIGPFSLLDFNTAYDYRVSIKQKVINNEMPPWTADSSFQHYFHERLLTQSERDIIINWVDEDGPSGNLVTAPPPPVFNGQILPGVPDLVVTMPIYMSKATTTQDDYACFSVPTNLLSDRKIKAIEVIPGNTAIVHHCLIYADPLADYPTDSIGLDCGGPTDKAIITAYTPGSSPTIFPSTGSFSSGISLDAGSNIIFAMHYPSGSYGQFDQTTVNIYFYPEPVSNFREVFAAPVLMDWSFNILANTIDTVDNTYADIAGNITMMSVFPHMHLLGKHIESYAITPSNDTIPFVRIPEWDFHWQDFYFFKYLLYVPAGSDLYGMGIYDNTTGNHHNPNDPPIDVSAGFNTTDEMFLIYFHFMLYNSGDEYINVDSLNTLFLNQPDYQNMNTNSEFNVFPNPSNNQVQIKYSLSENSFVSVYIYDVHGKLIRKLYASETQAGQQIITWDGTNDTGDKVQPGVYIYSARINEKTSSGKIILSR